MKKKLLAVLLSSAMVMAMVAGCGSKTTTEEGGDKGATTEGAHFEIIVKSFQSTYWQAAVKGVEQACEELGVTANCNGPANESDIADQIQMINDAIAKDPDGIGLAACDTNSVVDVLQAALDKEIPVVCFDTGVDKAPEGSVYATVATDNAAAGAVAAENIFPEIEEQIKAATADKPVRIGEVNQDATAQNIQQRGLGFINKMIELCTAAGAKVAVEGNDFYVNAAEGAVKDGASVIIEVAVPTQTTVDLATIEAQKILAKDDTIAIFGSNQTTAEGVIGADNGKLGSTVVAAGFDAGTPQKTAITAGKLLGSVTQSPLMMGYECVKTLNAIVNGESVADIPMDGYWYNADNMEDDSIAPNLYD